MALPTKLAGFVPFVALALCTSTVCSAAAADPEDKWDGNYDATATRRSDVVIGISGGLIVGQAVGYPNEVRAIDDPAFEADTGLGFGNGGSIWVGGALTDYLSFGLGTLGVGVANEDLIAGGGAFIIRLDVFPLFELGYPDLAFYGEFGVGGMQILEQDDEEERAEGGSMSVISVGAHYEIWRLGGFAFGPSLSYQHLYSQSLVFNGATLGMRAVFYTGP